RRRRPRGAPRRTASRVSRRAPPTAQTCHSRRRPRRAPPSTPPDARRAGGAARGTRAVGWPGAPRTAGHAHRVSNGFGVLNVLRPQLFARACHTGALLTRPEPRRSALEQRQTGTGASPGQNTRKPPTGSSGSTAPSDTAIAVRAVERQALVSLFF